MDEIKAIDISKTQKSIEFRYDVVLGITMVLILMIDIFILKNQHILLYIVMVIALGTNYIPNYITLNHIKCPYCAQKYFRAQPCDDKGLNQILGAKKQCDSCNRRALFIFSQKN